jgi:hypothetical protein
MRPTKSYRLGSANVRVESGFGSEIPFSEQIKKNKSMVDGSGVGPGSGYNVEKAMNRGGLREIVDWSRESGFHVTAKKVLMNNIVAGQVHNEFLKGQMQGEGQCFKYQRRIVEDKKMKQFKIGSIPSDELGRGKNYRSARDEYLQNRVKFGLFAGRELGNDGKVRYERGVRANQSDQRKASFLNGAHGNFEKKSERDSGTGTTHAGTGSSDNLGKNWGRVGNRELYSDFQNFFKRDWARDTQGNFVNSPQYRNGSRFPMPSAISGLYPRDMNQNYKLQAKSPDQGMTIEDLRKSDVMPYGNREAGQSTKKK